MEYTLNDKQIEILVNEMVESWKVYEFFGTTDIERIKRKSVKINNVNPTIKGWWNLVYNGEKISELNFETYRDTLDRIVALAN